MFADFTNQYQLSKTLRFELRPVGQTLEYIEQKGLTSQDEERSQDYKRVKELIDEYHKVFIGEALHGLRLGGVERYEELYFKAKKDEKEQDEFKKLQDFMRKEVAKQFTNHPKWANLFKAELIKIDLLASSVVTDEADREIIKKFKDFTTYFSGFHDNRQNMYSSDDKHSAIGYRIIHENLPIFLANKRLFEKIAKEYPELIADTKSQIEPYLLGAVFEDMFSPYHFSYTLSQIHIDLYNAMIGGAVFEDGTKVQGFNEKINLFRQKHNIDKKRLPNLKPLHKQILSDRESMSWLADSFENDSEMLDGIKKFYEEQILNFECCDGKVNVLDKLKGLFDDYASYDKSKIFIKNDRSITDISQSIFGDYSIIKEAIWSKYLVDNPKVQKSKDISADEEKFFSKKDSYFSLSHIEDALASHLANNEKHRDKLTSNVLFDYFKNFEFEQISTAYNAWLLDSTNKELTKSFLDALLSLQRFLKPLNVQTDSEKDIVFYAQFDTYFAPLSGVVKLYDKVRNHLTKKPYSLEKFKLNFESSYFLSGWVQDYETRAGLLFEYKGNYYLGINNKKLTTEEKLYLKSNIESNLAKRIILDFQKPDNKNIPRLFIRSKGDNFAPAVAKYDLPIDSVIEIYDSGKFKTEYRKVNPSDYIKSLHKLIDYFKEGFSKHESYKHYNFSWKPTIEYADIAQFYNDVETSCYQVVYEGINWDSLLEYVNSGKLYLFQIYNKDFSPYSKGTPNMHTLYWKMLFDENNLRDVAYKLNGQAEIFFRKKSLEYSEEILKNGHHHEALKDKFAYPIIKDRRFAFDKFQFHVPITLNFKATGNDNINQTVNEFIQKNYSNIKVIGIDRGERHLLYLTLIDADGKIIEQYSLNTILNTHNGKDIDYHQKLQAREDERAKARVEWKNIETIKELKEGYMSQVIHKIATLMVEHNAIVVLEDLNFGFKQGRFKVEKQVYQKFEKMLIDKLNYLVDKQKGAGELGGTLNALQLASKFESFEKMGKQSGFLFYVPAWNTSKIDPTTGFVNLFDTRYTSVEKAKEFFGKFKSISYNKSKGYFEFVFDYNDFTTKAEGTKTKWTLCTYGERIKTFRNKDKNNQWDSLCVNLTAELKSLFGADYDMPDLKMGILAQNDKHFFESLLYYLKLTLQMRNSVTGTDIDYLISPAADDMGEFYDSRKVDKTLPKDADANGAYNIARKGLMLIERIKSASDIKKLNLAISNKEWLEFAQR